MEYNIPQGGQLNTPPIGQMPGENPNGITAPIAPTLPVPPGMAAPQEGAPFNPDAMDPAGPFTGKGKSGFGAPNPFSGQGAPRGRPMQKTSGRAMAPYIFAQESGNRDNAPTSVNGAMGPGQMLPETFQRFAPPGASIRDPNANRAAAMKYLDYLAAKAGGDPAKIAAGYFSGEGNIGNGPQPFKRDAADGNGKRTSAYVADVMRRMQSMNPTGYTARIMQGVERPPAAASGIQSTPAGNPNMDMAELGAIMAMGGMKGGPEMMQLAQMSQPQNVPAGGYQRLADGTMQFVGDPYKEADQQFQREKFAQEQALAQQRVGLEAAGVDLHARSQRNEDLKTQRALSKDDRELAAAKAGDANHLNSINTNMDRMGQAASELLKDPGLPYNTGVWGALHVNALPGTAARDARARLETLKNKLVVDTMTALKEASATGSTGFGQLTEREGARLESMIANLDSAQSEEALRKQLKTIVDYAKQTKAMARQKYDSIYGGQQAAPSAAKPAPAKGGIKFLGFEK